MLLEVELLAQELRWKELGRDLNSGLGLLSVCLPVPHVCLKNLGHPPIT